ncbi:Oidioi.mRNA.OKI2018_I69.XSR.g16675.t1.cds [Oikopleura dioica]|uniref:Oidioi.mRNA.OKI2018_I69.XSR.g16675.t1.cds n=1 Tax=Oikopleura dioica TaxID=34765 RepID=A0ABN7SKW9_OIKDI|nr:Oidioi.mRNA.OKI2018_I69.XSR.g16675.t1.cds [Oikopleura dioica]
MSFAVSFHCWSEEESVFNSSDANIALNSYHPKKPTMKHSVFHEMREHWTRSRKEVIWSLSKENRDRLQKLNALLTQNRVLSILPRPLDSSVLMMFSNGSLVSFSLRNNDIDNITKKDKFIQHSSDPVDVAQVSEKYVVSLLSGSRISVIPPDLHRQISPPEPLYIVDMPDNACIRTKGSFSAVYWSERIEDGARGHLMIISHSGNSEIVARVPFNSLIQDVIFSELNADSFWLLEIPDPVNPTNIRMTLYSIKLNQGLKIVDELEIQMKSSVVVCELSPNEEKFCFGCSDNMLIVFDTKTHSAEHVYLPVRPSILSWHPGSHFLAVSSRNGEVMFFDVGLTCIELNDKISDPCPGVAYASLTTICDALIVKPLNYTTETQLEAALASFYAPTRAINDLVVIEYRDHVVRYARRFLHHLLRHRRLQKAFLLATDIGAQDLFLDIHHMALHYKDFELASEASKKVDEMMESPGEDDGRDERHDDHQDVDSEDDPPAIQRFMKHISARNSKERKKGDGKGKPPPAQPTPENASTLKIKHFGFV